MKKILLASLMALALSGCAVQHAGNYVQPTVQGQLAPSMNPVVSASVDILEQKYPPAKSALKLNVTDDVLFVPLMTALRHAGYAVYEIQPEPQFKTSTEMEKPAVPDSAQTLRYVFDLLDRNASLYQLTMTVDKTRIAGVFKLEHGQYKQVSPWTVF